MPGTVVTSESQAAGRGTFIVFREVAASVIKSGLVRAVFVTRLPWGPLDTQTAFSDAATFRATFAPAGFDRTGAGYLMATKFPWVDLQIIRVLGTTPVKATINLQKTGPTDCVAAPALYYGVGGNGITCVVAAATNAVANSFNLTVTKTDSTSGLSTVELYENVDSDQAAGTYWTNLTLTSKLLGPLVKSASGRPANGTYTLASGTDGSTIASANYLGTPGSADVGLSLAEKDPTVRFVFADDVPSGIHAAVRAGFKAHAILMTERIACIGSDSGDSEATSKTNATTSSNDHVAYMHHWGVVLNDAGTRATIPLTGAFAAICSTLQPHLSPAFKRPAITSLFASVIDLVGGATTKPSRINLASGNVIAWERNDNATYTPYNDETTSGQAVYATRMRDYITQTMAASTANNQNGPNDDETTQDDRTTVSSILGELKSNKTRDHVFYPCISDWSMAEDKDSNTQAAIDAGDRTIEFRVKLISARKRLFLVGSIGTTVTIAVATA